VSTLLTFLFIFSGVAMTEPVKPDEAAPKKVRVAIWTPEDFQDIKVRCGLGCRALFRVGSSFFLFLLFRFQVRTGQSSIAGAGSGEFHMYNDRTRRERERLAKLSQDDATKTVRAESERKIEELRRADEERTAKNRSKRQKRKKKEKKVSIGFVCLVLTSY
jgi:hypothetical protein